MAGRVGESFLKEMGLRINLKEWERFGKVESKEEEMKERKHKPRKRGRT